MVAKRDDFDVLVVGGGGAGMAASIEAARAGAKVLLIEKAAALGGTTRWSVGSFTSSCTPHQARAGIKDSTEAHFADLDKVNALAKFPDNLALRRLLTENSPDTFRWLLDLGLEFVGPNPEPPHRVPRMHNIVPGSVAFPYHLGRECRRLGVEIALDTALEDLLVTERAIGGVRATTGDGRQIELCPRLGTILATGDFSASSDLRRRFFPDEIVHAEPVNRDSTGDGIRIGERHGAGILNGPHCNAPRMRFVPGKANLIQRIPPTRMVARTMRWSWDYLPAGLIRPFVMKFLTTMLGPEPRLFERGAILVGSDGQRIPVGSKNIAVDLVQRPDNIGYIILDKRLKHSFSGWPDFVSTAPGIAYAYLGDYRAGRKDIYFEAGSVDALAAMLNLPAGNLRNSIGGMEAAEPPFVALGPVRGYVTITEGGLAVSDKLEVLGEGGRPLGRLYAAGSTGQGGLLIEGHGHHISWAFVSGRLAARNLLAA